MNRLLPMFLVIAALACTPKAQTAKSNDMKSDAQLENTRWKLKALPGLQPLPVLQKDVWIQFVLNSTNFRGHAGCNNMTGTFQKSEGNKLKIGPVAMTRMMCPEPNMKVEQLMTKAVNEADNYLIKGDWLQLRKGMEVLAEFEALYL